MRRLNTGAANKGNVGQVQEERNRIWRCKVKMKEKKIECDERILKINYLYINNEYTTDHKLSLIIKTKFISIKNQNWRLSAKKPIIFKKKTFFQLRDSIKPFYSTQFLARLLNSQEVTLSCVLTLV